MRWDMVGGRARHDGSHPQKGGRGPGGTHNLYVSEASATFVVAHGSWGLMAHLVGAAVVVSTGCFLLSDRRLVSG